MGDSSDISECVDDITSGDESTEEVEISVSDKDADRIEATSP